LGAFPMFLVTLGVRLGTFPSVWIGALRNELASPKVPAAREQIKQAVEFRGCPRGKYRMIWAETTHLQERADGYGITERL
jgi:hypothetical protein